MGIDNFFILFYFRVNDWDLYKKWNGWGERELVKPKEVSTWIYGSSFFMEREREKEREREGIFINPSILLLFLEGLPPNLGVQTNMGRECART